MLQTNKKEITTKKKSNEIIKEKHTENLLLKHKSLLLKIQSLLLKKVTKISNPSAKNHERQILKKLSAKKPGPIKQKTEAHIHQSGQKNHMSIKRNNERPESGFKLPSTKLDRDPSTTRIMSQKNYATSRDQINPWIDLRV